MSEPLVCHCDVIIGLVRLVLSAFTHRYIHRRLCWSYILTSAGKTGRCLPAKLLLSGSAHFIKPFNLLTLSESNPWTEIIRSEVSRTWSNTAKLLRLPRSRIRPGCCLLRRWFTKPKLLICCLCAILKCFTFKLKCLYGLCW